MDERRGLVVRRDNGEGCVDESASSTSNDRFSAGKHRTFVVRQNKQRTLLADADARYLLLIQHQDLYNNYIHYSTISPFVKLSKQNMT